MTLRPGSAVMFALLVLVTGCTASPGATVGTVGSGVITTPAAPATEPSGTKSFDEFVESSFEELTRREPQLVTALGLDAAYGAIPNQLDNLSPEYTLATTELADSVLSGLHTYDPGALSPDQRVTYRAFEWHLENTIAAEEFRTGDRIHGGDARNTRHAGRRGDFDR